MMLKLLVLLALALAWTAVLWLAFLPDVTALPRAGIAAMHVLPPAIAWAIWIILRRREQGKRTAAAQAREEAAQAERTAARDNARKKHDDEMRHRRFGCDCRMVAFSRLALMAPLSVAETNRLNIAIRPIHLDAQERAQEDPLLDYLMPAVADALSTIYSTCRASATFPVFLLPPADISGEEAIVRLRAMQSELALEYAPELKSRGANPPILFLPASDGISNSLVSLFETTPDLPGAIILAFDSPFSRADRDDDTFDDAPDPARQAREQYAGAPSEAVVALLMTNSELSSMCAAIAPATPSADEDSMTPYWDRAMQTGGQLAALARTSEESREELSELPVLGRVHRAAVRFPGAAHSGVLEATRVLQNVLEQAQVNAGLIKPPFTHDDVPADEDAVSAPERERPRCGAIVHNAGSVDVAGKRLAALGSALYYFDIDLSPVDNEVAINVVTRIGDIGRATGIGQLALGVVSAAVQDAPALCAEFLDGGRIAASFVMPPLKETQQDRAAAA